MTSLRIALVLTTLWAGASRARAVDFANDALPPGTRTTDAVDLMTRAFENYFRYSFVMRMDITIRPERGGELHRVLDMAHWRAEDHRSKWRISFQDPPHLRGTQLLAIEQRVRDDDHFVFTPDLKRVRRISGAQQAERIAGTDFSFEDLDIKYADQFELVLEGTGESGGRACRWVRGVPRYESAYERLRWCVDPEQQVILEVHGIGAEDRVIKTLRMDPSSVERISDRYLARRLEMTDERNGSRTSIEMLELHVDPSFSRDVFTAPSLERSFRLPFLSAYGSSASR